MKKTNMKSSNCKRMWFMKEYFNCRGKSATLSNYFLLKTRKKFFRCSTLRLGQRSLVFVPDSIGSSIQFVLPIHYHKHHAGQTVSQGLVLIECGQLFIFLFFYFYVNTKHKSSQYQQLTPLDYVCSCGRVVLGVGQQTLRCEHSKFVPLIRNILFLFLLFGRCFSASVVIVAQCRRNSAGLASCFMKTVINSYS